MEHFRVGRHLQDHLVWLFSKWAQPSPGISKPKLGSFPVVYEILYLVISF
jgi:hypothetical protein